MCIRDSIAPCGGRRHSISETRSKRRGSMSDVHHALREPEAVGLPRDAQRGERGALDLDRRLVPREVDALAPRARPEAPGVEAHLEAPEEQAPGASGRARG